MATPNCWRCLARPSQRILQPTKIIMPTIAVPFSTSTAQPKEVNAGGLKGHVRAGKRMVLSRNKKKRQPDKGRPVAPGERKAFRKRIQLRNDNALEVHGLGMLDAQNIVDPNAKGHVVGLPDHLVDQLRTVEAFKPTQNWGLFRSPHMLIRNETVDFVKGLVDAVKEKKTYRGVVTGERGSGKSMLGLQALSAAFLNNYIVIHLPEGNDLSEARTDYSPIPKTNMYSQPGYITKLMQTMQQANKGVFSKLTIQQDHNELPFTVTRGMPLTTLTSGTRENDVAWPAFQALWKELLLPGRPPIFFSLDGLSHIMRVSDYRSPSYDLIHCHDLGLIRMFTDALGGKTDFPNGAAILGVMTKGNCPKLPSVDKALEQAIAAQRGEPIPERDPWCRQYDDRVFDALKGVHVTDVDKVSKPEARALMEYWAASGILRMRVDEKNVSERWTLAGNGVMSELEKTSLYVVRL